MSSCGLSVTYRLTRTTIIGDQRIHFARYTGRCYNATGIHPNESRPARLYLMTKCSGGTLPESIGAQSGQDAFRPVGTVPSGEFKSSS